MHASIANVGAHRRVDPEFERIRRIERQGGVLRCAVSPDQAGHPDGERRRDAVRVPRARSVAAIAAARGPAGPGNHLAVLQPVPARGRAPMRTFARQRPSVRRVGRRHRSRKRRENHDREHRRRHPPASVSGHLGTESPYPLRALSRPSNIPGGWYGSCLRSFAGPRVSAWASSTLGFSISSPSSRGDRRGCPRPRSRGRTSWMGERSA